MRYAFVLFDVGETLLGPRESFGATYARVLDDMDLRLGADLLESALRATWDELNREIPRGKDRYRWFEGGEDGYWLRFARSTIERAAGVPVVDSFARDALVRLRAAFRTRETWEIFSDVEPALTALREAGVRLGVVSNWDSRLPSLLEMLGLAGYFDAITVSHLEGIEKPEPELFLRAVDRLGAEPRRTLHVGDLPELDLEGARAAGIDGVLVDRRRRLDARFNAIPDLSVLPGIVRSGTG